MGEEHHISSYTSYTQKRKKKKTHSVMGVTDVSHNSFEFEDSGNFTFQYSSSYDEDTCSSPDSVFEYTFPTVS